MDKVRRLLSWDSRYASRIMQVSMSRRRGVGWGEGYRHRRGNWTLPLSHLWRFWPQILPQTMFLLTPPRDILPHLNYFPVARVGNLPKKMRNNSNAAPMHVPAPPSKHWYHHINGNKHVARSLTNAKNIRENWGKIKQKLEKIFLLRFQRHRMTFTSTLPPSCSSCLWRWS